MPVTLSVDQRAIQAAAAALKYEIDGKALRRELIRDMRAAAAPLVTDLKAAIQAAPSAGHAGVPLRPAIAKGVGAAVRLGGASTGVAIRAKQTGSTRGFRNAARRFNKPSWRHPVFGNTSAPWVVQTGKPNWFDDTTKGHRDVFHDAVMKAVEDMAARVAARH